MQRSERRGDSPRRAKATDAHGDWISHDFHFLLSSEFLTFWAATTSATFVSTAVEVKGSELRGLSVRNMARSSISGARKISDRRGSRGLMNSHVNHGGGKLRLDEPSGAHFEDQRLHKFSSHSAKWQSIL